MGIDYFGPLHVGTGPVTRSMKNPRPYKCYEYIFTCLRYRAVHIEVVNDLSTDSCTNAVTRFVGRRGPPKVIYSNNGTNIRGAGTDIAKALKIWVQKRSEVQRKNVNPRQLAIKEACGSSIFVLFTRSSMSTL